ncbi:MAG: hypothetical protein WC609_00245 [Candidatus Paceibacterota bacterium]|jgi:uncharacterized protein (UPF0333 family)
MNSNIFDRLSFLSLFLVVILLPLFCLPFTNIPVETSKGLFLVLGLAVSIIFWAIARFVDGKVVFPKSWLLVSGFGVSLVLLLSALFSGRPGVSLFGTMFDIGSFWFIFSGFVLMFMSAVVFRTLKQARIVLFGTILSSALVLIFQGFHLFMPKILSLGILADKTGNVLGSWNALGLFAGFSGLMFLLVIEVFSVTKIEKILLEIFILTSILLAAAVNFPLVWILLGISSLIIFVYKVSITVHKNEEGGEKRKNFPVISFVVVIIALLFFLNPLVPIPTVGMGYLGDVVPSLLHTSNTEISPSLGATMSITKGVLVKHPLLGIGPNRFSEAWSMYKPLSINDTQFWDVSFNSGSGLLTTFFATTGGLGILSWLVFFILFLFIGIKSIFSNIKNGVNWDVMVFFVLSIYLLISSFFYFTGVTMFLLSFALIGVFIGLIASSSGREVSILFLNDHRKSFFSILVLILLVVFSIAISFKYIEKFASVSYFGKALSASTEANAETNIRKALGLYQNDLYLRTYSQIYLLKLKSVVNKGADLSDEDKASLQTSFDQVISGAQGAVNYNPLNYLNSQLLGSMYEEVGALGVKDAYSNAVVAYGAASLLNPLNPGIKLAQASAAFSDGKTQEAKDYALAALSLKGDYVDALVILSQIAKKQGNSGEALTYAQKALSLVPTDKNLIQYVDSLKNSNSTPEPTPAEVAPKR